MSCIPVQYLRGKSGLSRVEIALLAYVMEHPSEQGSRAEIASDCDCAPNYLSKAARRLEERGLLERVTSRGLRTSYRVGRNLQVTTSNTSDTTSNMEVTTTSIVDDTTLDVVVVTPKQTTTGGVVSLQVTTCEYPPHTPLDITTTSNTENNLQTPELGGDRGLGKEPELFATPTPAPKPKRASRRRPRREKFYATADTMPETFNDEMGAYALTKGMRNGTRDEQYAKFRRWHIREQTLIASLEQRWETWVDNWAKSNPQKPSPANMKLLGYGPDGKARYQRPRTTY